LPLLGLQLAQFVVEFDHDHGFHEQRCAARGLVMHDALKLAPVFGSHGNAAPVVADHDHRVLDHRAVRRRRKDLVQPFGDARGDRAQPSPDRGQIRRGGIEHLGVAPDGQANVADELRKLVNAFCPVR
jgi:hypothetical protein